MKYTVVTPVLHEGKMIESGSIDLDEERGAILCDRGVLRAYKARGKAKPKDDAPEKPKPAKKKASK